jgi:hypothetical protein
MMTKKNAPYSSNRRKANQQVAGGVGSWMREKFGMETPSEKKAKEKANPKPEQQKPDTVIFGGTAGKAEKALRGRQQVIDDASGR